MVVRKASPTRATILPADVVLPAGVLDIMSNDEESVSFGRGGEYTRAFVNFLWSADSDMRNGDALAMREGRPSMSIYLPNQERRKRPQQSVDPEMRHCLVDWLVDIAEEFKVKRSTLYLCVNLLDRSLDTTPVRREKLQLLGCACFLVAAKLEEVTPTVSSHHKYCTHIL
jgi:hypothetical protein